MMTRKAVVINHDHDHDYEDHDDSNKDYNGHSKIVGSRGAQDLILIIVSTMMMMVVAVIMMMVGSIVGSRGTLSLLLKFQASRLRLPAFQLLAFRLTRQQDYLQQQNHHHCGHHHRMWPPSSSVYAAL